jgi:hypothetical protein
MSVIDSLTVLYPKTMGVYGVGLFGSFFGLWLGFDWPFLGAMFVAPFWPILLPAYLYFV